MNLRLTNFKKKKKNLLMDKNSEILLILYCFNFTIFNKEQHFTN